MKIASIIGARPQFIKYAPLSRELRKLHQEIIIHTGQHYDYEMDRVFFDELEIPKPGYNLEVGSGTHGYQTGEMLRRIEGVLVTENPDLVLVYGDTNSTLAGALAAVKLQIKVGHVEAGLRSFDKTMPEEINRVLTDHCSDYLFCPTQTAADNLKREGIVRGVYVTGDVMVDALLYNKEIAERSNILDRLGLESNKYLVSTIHRQANTDYEENLRSIVDAYCEIDEIIVFPLHPRTEKFLKEYGLYGRLTEKVKLTEPLGYLEFLKLLSHAMKVLTDSGGIQKEAYILKVPCITLRDNTEWVETVEDGWNVLVGVDKERIVRMAREFQPNGEQRNIFGQDACQEISKAIGH
ncbi:MAG TPA: UDP-N-acetylglucosamine 2-epimerase (non-hydrolyzing) [Dehalococcoidia bacterium]|nr:UDP-N-acetylglucosamine 2-epimerase (non-hydrolyzing) [Dehalococcoidia bacterium]